jgi:hypothetical protein
LKKTAYIEGKPRITANYAPFVEALLAPAGFNPGFIAAVDVA